MSADYTSGLAEIEQLRPVIYTFKGNETDGPPAHAAAGLEPPPDAKLDEPLAPPYRNSPHYRPALDGKEYIGLVAQECEAILPEIISRHNGTIDGVSVDDLRVLDHGPLIFTLINAVKELSARVKALEAGP